MNNIRSIGVFSRDLEDIFEGLQKQKDSLESVYIKNAKERIETKDSRSNLQTAATNLKAFFVKLRFKLKRFNFRLFDPLSLLLSPFLNFYKQFKALRVQSRDFAIMDRMLNFDNRLEFLSSVKSL